LIAEIYTGLILVVTWWSDWEITPARPIWWR
jgi:hypothetical protein